MLFNFIYNINLPHQVMNEDVDEARVCLFLIGALCMFFTSQLNTCCTQPNIIDEVEYMGVRLNGNMTVQACVLCELHSWYLNMGHITLGQPTVNIMYLVSSHFPFALQIQNILALILIFDGTRVKQTNVWK